MAIFASTTTSGYSDPLKALTIKALEKRQADLLAQQAQQQPDPAMMSTIPGGIGHVLGQIGDRMQQSRADQALAAQKEALARAISGYDVTSGAPPPSAIATIAPDMYKDMMQTWAENRRAAQADARARELQKESLAHTTTESGLTRKQQKELAEQSDTRARELQKERLAAEADLETKKAETAARVATADPVKEKARLDLQKSLTQKQLMASRLERAGEAFSHPEGIHPGALGRLRAEGTAWTGIGDKEKSERTILFDTAMDEVATGKMADVLTGPSTNFELQKFIEMGNNPKVSLDERRAQFANVLNAMKKDRDATATSVRRTGGDVTDPTIQPAAPAATTVTPSGGGGGPPRPANMDDAAILAEAQKSMANATPEQKAQIQQRLQGWGIKGL